VQQQEVQQQEVQREQQAEERSEENEATDGFNCNIRAVRRKSRIGSREKSLRTMGVPL